MARSGMGLILCVGTVCGLFLGCTKSPPKTTSASSYSAAEAKGTNDTLGADDSKPSLAAAEWREVVQLKGHGQEIKSLVFLHNGDQLLSASYDGTLKIWEIPSGRELQTISAHTDGRFSRFAISSKGDRLATADFDRNIKVWDTTTWQCLATFQGSSAIYCLAFSHDGRLLATSGEWTIDIWDCDALKKRMRVDAGFWPVGGLGFSLDSLTLFAAGFDCSEKILPPTAGGLLRAFDVTRGQLTGESKLQRPADCLTVSPDGRFIAVGAVAVEQFEVHPSNGSINFESRHTFVRMRENQGQLVCQEQFNGLAYSYDGSILAASAAASGPFFPKAGHIQLLNGSTCEPITLLIPPRPVKENVQAGQYSFNAVAVSPDGRRVAGGGAEQVATVWEQGATRLTPTAAKEDYETMVLPGRSETEPQMVGNSADQQKLSETARKLSKTQVKSRQKLESIEGNIGKANSEADRARLFAKIRIAYADTVREVLEFSQSCQDDDSRFDALAFALFLTTKMHSDALLEQRVEIIETLEQQHMRDSELSRVFYLFEHCIDDTSETFLRSVTEKSPNRAVRAHAWYSLGKYLVNKAEGARRYHSIRQLDDQTQQVLEIFPHDERRALEIAKEPELKASAESAFERVLAEFCDVPQRAPTYSRTTAPVLESGSPLLGRLAEQALFKLRSLAIGQVAPAIVGEDCDGRPLRLKDYRGKVVVLCFSADWCGACVAQYPHYRALIERLKDQPFAMLQVNGDTSLESLKRSIGSHKITWPCWWDGPNGGGPIAAAWQVEAWPALYVLDQEGVIRNRNVFGAKLDQAVNDLLAHKP